MTTINAGDHKERFNNLRPDDQTQAEFLNTLLDTYTYYDEDSLDVERIFEAIRHEVGSEAELAAYRGAREAIEEHHD